MSSAYDKLERILCLEESQGCRNRAVIGGLAPFVNYWQKEAREQAGHADLSLLVDHVVDRLTDYADLDTQSRQQIVDELLRRLGEAKRRPSPVQPSVPSRREKAAPEGPQETKPSGSTSDSRPSTRNRDQSGDQVSLTSPVTVLRGISDVRQERLARLGIRVIKDLLYHFPRRYDDFGQLKTINRLALGDEVTVVGIVRETKTRRSRSGRTIVQSTISDGTDSIEATWFNQPYLERQLSTGREVVLSGKVEEYLGRLVLNSPQWEPLRRELLHTGRLVPVYPLTGGINVRWLRRLIKRILDYWTPRIIDPLPEAIIRQEDLIDLDSALEQIHFPDSREMLTRARQRLCFDEFLLLQLGVLHQRQVWRAQVGKPMDTPHSELNAFIQGLSFELTAAQRRAIDEILADLEQAVPASRLLQGDVGSGKTVVAVAAMLAVIRNDFQVAIMAPTFVLAEQHYATVSELLGRLADIRCELLVGSMAPGEKERIRDGIAEGAVDLVVGTHALIQESVDFARLGMVIVDEQHRFGVEQRGALRAKGADFQPHLLVMSATPIPRTLAMTVYGDLDLSVLDEMPPNRQPVLTAVRDRGSRERIYCFIKSEVQKGRQGFVVCPLVEESDKTEAAAAVEEHRRLQQEIFPHLKLGLLHGRMNAEEKDRVMAEFKQGLYDILVTTAVIEVGIDVPNASVMLVKGAERFGLAQLHQFRGRVGRGAHKSYCILLSDSPSDKALERLRIMEETSDGFVLAEMDLQMRGPGQFFGVRQHGLPELKVAELSDTLILERARAQAQKLFGEDPLLEKPEHRALASSMRSFWSMETENLA